MSLAEILPKPPKVKRRHRRLHGFDEARVVAAAEKGTRLGGLTWYALRVEPQKELAAEEILKNLGYAAFVPVELKFPRLKRGSRARDKSAPGRRYPIFQGHVLCGFEGAYEGDVDPRWNEDTQLSLKHQQLPMYVLRELDSTLIRQRRMQGFIKGVYGAGGEPLIIPAKAVMTLLNISGTSIPWRKTRNPHKSYSTDFRKGDTVEIVEGAFTGHTLPILDVKGKFAEFILRFLGSEQKVKVPLAFLEAA